SNAIAGDYVITFSPIPYYNIPPPQTNTLTGTAPLIFRGTYSFTDINNNQISDSWEQQYFNEVSPDHSGSTDSDLDGMTDLAEFIAGTDPTDFASRLELAEAEMMAGNRVRLTWSSVADKTYQVLGSSDAVKWQAFSGEIPASGTQTTFSLPLPADSNVFFFKLQVIP
ncbi:MAG TPA: hypothetical protein VGR78_03855, partial [Verrucomicrobiae bacterium]|nr:hypothetical protein [Verrucomicrobiae bacterium]